MITPHGGALVNRYVDGEQAKSLKEEAKSLPVVPLNHRQLLDAHMIAQGAFSPLEGFIGHEDYMSVVNEMRLANGVTWTMPVTLASDTLTTADLREGTKVALADGSGEIVGVLTLEGKFRRDRQEEAQKVYRTTEDRHPGVAGVYRDGDVLLAGKIVMLQSLPKPEDGLAPHHLTPSQTRKRIESQGWNTVAGFHTRNPVHRAQEYIHKCALEIVDGLLLHPLVGETREGDIPTTVRMRCYETLLEVYYPRNNVLLSTLPSYMRYAGPREAVFHALVRKNYGCTHFIVGRDHAGVGSYYGAYDSQSIFSEFDPEALGIRPMFFESSFYCRRCHGMATERSCPHGPDERFGMTSAQLRDMLSQGRTPPKEFTRPEVARILIDATPAARTA